MDLDELPHRRRFFIAGVLLCIIALGLASRQFAHVLPVWMASHAGDTLWTVAVFLAIAFCFPKWSSLLIGVLALLISFVVEFSQLIDLPFLNKARSTLPGRLLLGSGFLWIDLVRYSIGAILATGFDCWLTRRR